MLERIRVAARLLRKRKLKVPPTKEPDEEEPEILPEERRSVQKIGFMV